jgi:hypothetical protein
MPKGPRAIEPAVLKRTRFGRHSAPHIRSSGILEAMKPSTFCRNGVALLILGAALPALADTRFQIRRMTRNDVPLGKGQCDIRLQVDNEVEVSVRRDMVNIRTISGRDARDDGSECNAPLPDRETPGFNFEVVDSRNGIKLLAEPSRRNDFTAIVAIRDSSGGEGRYHFRLSWQMTGGDNRGGDDRPPARREEPPVRRDDDDRRGADDRRGPDDRRGGPGFSWNNVVSFQGRGRGRAAINNSGEQRLSDANVDIDRGGKVVVSFRIDRGRPLVFNGFLIADEGGRLKADMATEDRRLRGPMFLSVDERHNINSITLEATDGRDHMQVAWDRR